MFTKRGEKAFILQLLLQKDNSKFTVEEGHGKKLEIIQKWLQADDWNIFTAAFDFVTFKKLAP